MMTTTTTSFTSGLAAEALIEGIRTLDRTHLYTNYCVLFTTYSRGYYLL